jgi:hypothetical protein
LGSSRPGADAPVSMRDDFVCPTDGPLRCAPKFHLVRRSSSSEFLRIRACSSDLSTLSWPTWGFVPLRDLTAPRPLTTSTSQALATFRPRAFAAPRRFAPRCGSWVCSTPLPRAGLSAVQGLLPSCSLSPLIGKNCPLVVQPSRAHRPKPAATTRAPRLRGFAPHEIALSTAWCYPPRSSLPSSGSRSLRALIAAVPCSYLRGSTHDVASPNLRLRVGSTRPSSASLRRRS